MIDLTTLTIRPFQTTDTTAVHTLSRLLTPEKTPYIDPQRTWVVVNGRFLAYLTLLPVPGLDGVFELEGGVHPQWQRQGIGSWLWTSIQAQLNHTPIHQLSYCVTDMNSPTAHFLQKHGFTVEHEEWELIRPFLTNLPPVTDLPNVRSATFSNRNRAIKTFCTLYDNSFATYPWYQPYTAAEVAATLATSQDILFLRRDDIPIGFAWLHIEDGIGEIEPFGIVDAWQGHGYGRILLTAALHQLAQHGATSAQIGAWHNNAPALHLYQSLGFQHTNTLTYLALTLKK